MVISRMSTSKLEAAYFYIGIRLYRIPTITSIPQQRRRSDCADTELLRCTDNQTFGRLLRSFRVSSSNGQQAVDIYLVLCAYIYMPVHDGRDVEP
jgi:hypothetical protein